MNSNVITLPRDAHVFKAEHRVRDLKTGHTYNLPACYNATYYIAKSQEEIERCFEVKRADFRAHGLDFVDISIWAISEPEVIGTEGVIELYASHSLKTNEQRARERSINKLWEGKV